MKKLLIISFAVAVLAIGGGVFIHTALIGSDPILAVAVLAIGGGVFIHTALIGSDPILEANVEALSRGESGSFGPLCSKTERTGIYRMKSCKDCDGPTGKYAMDIVAYCN